MFEEIKDAFSRFSFLGPKELFLLATNARLLFVKKDELLIKEGDLNYSIFTVKKGLLRHYVINENGEDRTLLFVPEKRHTSIAETIFHNNRSNENIEALENSIVIKFDYRIIEEITANNLHLLKLQNQALKESILTAVDQIKFLNLLTPEERYLHFCKTFPSIEQRVKQKHLASYLGITPTSLSRMRARLIKD